MWKVRALTVTALILASPGLARAEGSCCAGLARLEGIACVGDRARTSTVAPGEPLRDETCEAALPGVIVQLGDERGVIAAATSDEHGLFEIHLPAGPAAARLAGASLSAIHHGACRGASSYMGFQLPLELVLRNSVINAGGGRLALALPRREPDDGDGPVEDSPRFTLNATASGSAARRAEVARLGHVARSRTVEDLDGRRWPLAAPGRHTLLSFWAPWCRPCLDALPELRAIRSRWPEHELRMIGISLACTDPDELRRFADDHPEVTWPLTCDGFGAGSTAEAFGVNSIPAEVLIGPRGEILATLGGDDGELVDLLAHHLD